MKDLSNIKYAIGENFSMEGNLSTGGSKTLNNYKPIFDATVISKLKSAGAIAIQTKVNEFEIDANHISETSSIVAKNEVSFGIGSDTNGILRLSANKENIIGFKPTYGLISRFGLYAVASVFDTVGIYGKTINDIRDITNIIKGADENDMNSWNSEELTKEKVNPKLFYIKELINDKFIENLKKASINAEEVSINNNLISAIKPIHTCIMSAEMTTTLANLTGIPFGPCAEGKDADEMMINYRTNFTANTKINLTLGTYSLLKEQLDSYYHNSLRLRGMLFNELNTLFQKYDGLISMCDETNLLIANLCGYPSITINQMLLTCAQKQDNLLLNIAQQLEGGK